MSTPPTSSASPPPKQRTKNLCAGANTSITGRRTWKMLRKKDEIVWPPDAEAMLLEALTKYAPSGHGDPNRVLLRFPRRNRFISEYILKNTGIFRTAKQVGSRLQQLRDTCEDKQFRSLLPRRQTAKEKAKPVLASSPPSPSPSLMLSPKLEIFTDSPTTPSSWSDISSMQALSTDAEPLLQVSASQPNDMPPRMTPPTTIHVLIRFEDPSSNGLTGTFPRHASSPPARRSVMFTGSSPLWTVQPTVAFRSSTLYSHSLVSSFTVLLDDRLIHTEKTHLVMQSGTQPYVYRTNFLPVGWAQLCLNTDLRRCVVVQDITEAIFLLNGTRHDRHVLTISYAFEELVATLPRFSELDFFDPWQSGMAPDPFSSPAVQPGTSHWGHGPPPGLTFPWHEGSDSSATLFPTSR